MSMRTPPRWSRPKRLRPPGFIVPCQPILAAKVPAGDGWLHELKHDRFRIIAHKDGERVRLWSRNGRDWSAEFVAITEAMRALPKAGDLVADDPHHGEFARCEPARDARRQPALRPRHDLRPQDRRQRRVDPLLDAADGEMALSVRLHT